VVFDACRNTLKLTQPGSRAIVQAKGSTGVHALHPRTQSVRPATGSGHVPMHHGLRDKELPAL
jgi:hypothetical protein